MGRVPRLWRIAPATIAAVCRVTGQSATINRLIGGLRVDSSLIRHRLRWQSPVSLSDGLADVARWYLDQVELRRTGIAG
jgi:nucleoside-diphosphate-sugar epimerase